MSQLRMNDDGDIDITNNRFSLVFNNDEIRQSLLQRLRTFAEEWFLDTTIGVPYFQAILVKNPNPNLVDSFLINEILATPGVIELLEFALDFDSAMRQLNVTFRVRVPNGELVIDEVII